MVDLVDLETGSADRRKKHVDNISGLAPLSARSRVRPHRRIKQAFGDKIQSTLSECDYSERKSVRS